MQQVSLDATSVVAAQTGLLTQVLDGGWLVVLRMLGALYQSCLTARAPGRQSWRRAQSQMVRRPTQSRLAFCARLTVLVFAFRLCSWIAFMFTLFRICGFATRYINQKKRTQYIIYETISAYLRTCDNVLFGKVQTFCSKGFTKRETDKLFWGAAD